MALGEVGSTELDQFVAVLDHVEEFDGGEGTVVAQLDQTFGTKRDLLAFDLHLADLETVGLEVLVLGLLGRDDLGVDRFGGNTGEGEEKDY